MRYRPPSVHQFVVAAELDHPALLEDADPVGMADRREPVRDEDRGDVPAWRSGSGRRSRPRPGRPAGRSARRAAPVRRLAGRRTALAPVRPVATDHRRDRCRRRSPWPAGCRGRPGHRRRRPRARRRMSASGAPAGATLSRSGSSSRRKSWNTAVTRVRQASTSRSRRSIAVDLDRSGVRVVQPAQQLGQGGLAGAVLADDRQRRAGRHGQVEAVEDRSAGVRIPEAQVPDPDPDRSGACRRYAGCRATVRS